MADAKPPADSAFIRVLLWTCTPSLARGFLCLAKERQDLEAAVSADELSPFLDTVERFQPVVVLLDTTTDGRVDFPRIIETRKRVPQCQVVLWTHATSVEVAHRARAAGLRGVLLKNAPDTEIFECLTRVARGEFWFELSLLNSMLDVREVRLSRRERQLVSLVSQGLSNKQLAAELMISEGTVKVYLAKLFRKVNVHDRYELALLGLKTLGLAPATYNASAATLLLPVTTTRSRATAA